MCDERQKQLASEVHVATIMKINGAVRPRFPLEVIDYGLDLGNVFVLKVPSKRFKPGGCVLQVFVDYTGLLEDVNEVAVPFFAMSFLAMYLM